MVIIVRAGTLLPPDGDIFTIVPKGAVGELTSTTFTKTPNPDSSPAAAGVLMPTTFGSVKDTFGQGMVLVVVP